MALTPAASDWRMGGIDEEHDFPEPQSPDWHVWRWLWWQWVILLLFLALLWLMIVPTVFHA